MSSFCSGLRDYVETQNVKVHRLEIQLAQLSEKHQVLLEQFEAFRSRTAGRWGGRPPKNLPTSLDEIERGDKHSLRKLLLNGGAPKSPPEE